MTFASTSLSSYSRASNSRPRQGSERLYAPPRGGAETGRLGGRSELVTLRGQRQRGLEGHQGLVRRIERDLIRNRLVPRADPARPFKGSD